MIQHKRVDGIPPTAKIVGFLPARIVIYEVWTVCGDNDMEPRIDQHGQELDELYLRLGMEIHLRLIDDDKFVFACGVVERIARNNQLSVPAQRFPWESLRIVSSLPEFPHVSSLIARATARRVPFVVSCGAEGGCN